MGASVYSERFEKPASTYALQVEAGKPFSLYGLQEKWEPWTTREMQASVLGWTKVDHPGSADPLVLDLDFASKLTPVTVKGTFTLPSSPGSLVGTASRPRFWINQGYAGILVGVCTRTTLQTNGEFAFEGEYLKLADATGVQTVYFAEVGYGLHGSYLAADGYPAEGAKAGSNFLDVPTMVQPKNLSTPAPFDQPIEWKNPEPTAVPVLGLVDATKNELRWTVEMKPGTASLVLPEPPSTAVTDAVLPETVSARVQLFDHPGGPSLACPRFAHGTRLGNGPLFQIRTTYPKTVTITGFMKDFETSLPVSDGQVCVMEEPTISCATTDAKGAYALADVPNDKDLTLSLKKAGYVSYALSHGIHQIGHNYLYVWLPSSSLKTLETKLGSPLEASKGLMVVSVSGLGTTVKLTPAAGVGPVYADTSGWPDPSLKGTTSRGWVWFGNLPPGNYEATVTSSTGAPCRVTQGWKGTSPGSARVSIQANTLFGTATVCD